jgi:hypothetical protein
MQFLWAGGSQRERSTAGSEILASKLAPKLESKAGRRGQGDAAGRLRAVAAILLTLAATTPASYAQQEGAATAAPDKAASDLPVAPVPVATQPIPLRTSDRDYSKAFGTWFGNPINVFRPTTVAKASFATHKPAVLFVTSPAFWKINEAWLLSDPSRCGRSFCDAFQRFSIWRVLSNRQSRPPRAGAQ